MFYGTGLLYKQHFLFFVTCEWAKYAKVLYYTRLERVAKEEHLSILSPFVNYA
jgi:hypothetical protein